MEGWASPPAVPSTKLPFDEAEFLFGSVAARSSDRARFRHRPSWSDRDSRRRFQNPGSFRTSHAPTNSCEITTRGASACWLSAMANINRRGGSHRPDYHATDQVGTEAAGQREADTAPSPVARHRLLGYEQHASRPQLLPAMLAPAADIVVCRGVLKYAPGDTRRVPAVSAACENHTGSLKTPLVLCVFVRACLWGGEGGHGSSSLMMVASTMLLCACKYKVARAVSPTRSTPQA